jgi:glycosyltransferase involved in cell wall biosynthesis
MAVLPLVSVTIPTRNSEAHLAICLEAIRHQTYPNLEIIQVDGFSTDGTLDIAKRYSVDQIVESNDALLGARAIGLATCSGEYVLLLDSDQILAPTCIARAVELMGTDVDMLVLEEGVYSDRNWIEKLFVLDRKLIHLVRDFSPYTGVMMPRFYRTALLRRAFANIDEASLRDIGGQDHAIIYLECWALSERVDLLPDAVKHIEPNSLMAIWKKFYRWGYTSIGARQNKYTKLLQEKEKFRKGIFREGVLLASLASILLLLIKGVPYKLGVFIGKASRRDKRATSYIQEQL